MQCLEDLAKTIKKNKNNGNKHKILSFIGIFTHCATQLVRLWIDQGNVQVVGTSIFNVIALV